MKFLVATLFAFAASTTASEAAVIDFVAEAAANPGGLANGYTKNFGGFNVTITSARGNPYLDGTYLKRPGGLGACVLVGGPGSICNSQVGQNSDNVGKFDAITLDFGRPADLSGFSFTDALHFDLSASTNTLLVNGAQWTFAALFAATLTGVQTLTLAYGGSNPSEFYLNSIAAVPLPAAAPLILSGIAGLGFAARRRKRAV